MRIVIRILLIIILLTPVCSCSCKEFLYILNDKCTNELYEQAEDFFNNTPVLVIRDTRGILLRFELKYPMREFDTMSIETYKKLLYIQQFLAKIKNSAIIEVHTVNFEPKENYMLKNWEISTVIANKIESVMIEPRGELKRDRIRSVGYGEFLPAQNTSNNGGNYSNRVDIMILCNISGE